MIPHPLAKLIPTLVVVATVGYLGWPYFDAAPLITANREKQPEIAAELLRPTEPPSIARDPFGVSVRFQLADNGDGGPPQRRTANAGGAAINRAAAAPGRRQLDSIGNGGPALSGTLLLGNTRIAFIDGLAYQQGESLPTSGSQKPAVLAEIHHHHVVLTRDGEPVELRYSDKSASANSGPPTRQQTVGKSPGRKRPPAAPRQSSPAASVPAAR